MADIRNIGGQSLVPQARGGVQPVRNEAVRAAQRAFFEAALSGAATAPSPPAAAAGRTQAAPTRSIQADDSAGSGRLLRPGSIVDIKV